MFEVDAIVIGAGAVGLATAQRLADAGIDVVVLEAASAIGTGISSRNSEVIHAGMYYPTGSLKQRLCVDGRRQLYHWAEARGVSFQKLGKLIVATAEDQIQKLEAIHTRGCDNDVENLSFLTREHVLEMEPALRCYGALHSPETGILDSHGFMLSLQGALEDKGGQVVLNSPVTKISADTDGTFIVHVGGADPTQIRSKKLVNSASLHAYGLAREMEGYDFLKLPDFTLAKGSYFSCDARSPFSHLIYPVPVDGGLGVHVTLDLGGAIRFGPDVEWLNHTDPDKIDWRVDIGRADGFYDAIRTYWPGLPEGSIMPSYSGCRPKLSRSGEAPADFRIDGPEHHGIDGLIHLLGIESPGLTSSLAIADDVFRQLS